MIRCDTIRNDMTCEKLVKLEAGQFEIFYLISPLFFRSGFNFCFRFGFLIFICSYSISSFASAFVGFVQTGLSIQVSKISCFPLVFPFLFFHLPQFFLLLSEEWIIDHKWQINNGKWRKMENIEQQPWNTFNQNEKNINFGNEWNNHQHVKIHDNQD